MKDTDLFYIIYAMGMKVNEVSENYLDCQDGDAA